MKIAEDETEKVSWGQIASDLCAMLGNLDLFIQTFGSLFCKVLKYKNARK